jgi:FkbM family methyltransferase
MLSTIGKKSLVSVFDRTLGAPAVQRLLCSTFGNQHRGLMLPAIRYRARFMVLPGETAVLVGVFSVGTVRRFLDAVGSKGTVVVVEANPANVARIRCQFESRDNLIFVNKAVWKEKGTITFIASDLESTQGYNRIKTDEIAEYPYHMERKVSEIQVECDRLDAILRDLELQRVDHVNLTCNGAEVTALESLIPLMSRHPGIRVYANTQAPQPFGQYVSVLQAHGFRYHVSQVSKVRNQRIQLNRVYAYRDRAPTM